MQVVRVLALISFSLLFSSCGSGDNSERSSPPPEIKRFVARVPDACVVVTGDLGALNYLAIKADGTKSSGFLTVPIGSDWEHDLEWGLDSVRSTGGAVVAGCTKDANVAHLTSRARQDIEALAGPVRLWILEGEKWHEEHGLTFASPPPAPANLGPEVDSIQP